MFFRHALGLLRGKGRRRLGKTNVTKNDGIKKVEFYETEKVREKMEDMRLYIQIVMESRSFCIVGN